MPSLITSTFSYLTIFSHILFVFLLAAFLSRRSWGGEIIGFVHKHAVPLSFLFALGGAVGSLLYSNLVGFEPCELCWWQRIFLFPQVVLFLVALIKKERRVFIYSVPLAFLGSIVALYHTYIQLGGETSVLPCTSAGAACAKVLVLEHGYITIPTMSLTVFLFILLFAFIHRFYENHNA